MLSGSKLLECNYNNVTNWNPSPEANRELIIHTTLTIKQHSIRATLFIQYNVP